MTAREAEQRSIGARYWASPPQAIKNDFSCCSEQPLARATFNSPATLKHAIISTLSS